MTLAEKILSLRTERGMSQDDLAEKLEVSRQSVSKWETGQSTPDLDRIIRLADLFGVSVDELVREGERPQPPEPKVVYVEREPKSGLTAVQKTGIVFEGIGVVMIVFGFLVLGFLILVGAALVILGLPLLLAKKHPVLIDGWIVLATTWFLFPRMGLTPSKLWFGLEWLNSYLAMPGPGRKSILLGGIIVVVQRILLLVLLYFTLRPLLRTWKKRKNPERDS